MHRDRIVPELLARVDPVRLITLVNSSSATQVFDEDRLRRAKRALAVLSTPQRSAAPSLRTAVNTAGRRALSDAAEPGPVLADWPR